MIVWDATLNADVLTLALSPTKDAVPSDVVPSKNVTEPVGVVDVLVTKAVKVTLWPNVEGFRLDTSVSVGVAWFTVWVIDVLSVL